VIYGFYFIFTVTDHNIVYMFVNMIVKKMDFISSETILIIYQT